MKSMIDSTSIYWVPTVSGRMWTIMKKLLSPEKVKVGMKDKKTLWGTQRKYWAVGGTWKKWDLIFGRRWAGKGVKGVLESPIHTDQNECKQEYSMLLTDLHITLPDGMLTDHTGVNGWEWRSKQEVRSWRAEVSIHRAVVVPVQCCLGQPLAHRHSICTCGMN